MKIWENSGMETGLEESKITLVEVTVADFIKNNNEPGGVWDLQHNL
jgi:hypothetical protein